MAAKLYYAYIALSRVFAEIFQKVFLHTAPTIPKLGTLLRCIALDKSRAILNCRLFAFALKIILNLILKLNLKMNSNSKLVLNLILNLILNLKMFHVKHENEFTKSPFMGRKLYYRDSVLSRTFLKKFLAYLPPESQKEKAPREEPRLTYENCSMFWSIMLRMVVNASSISSFCFLIISRSRSLLAFA